MATRGESFNVTLPNVTISWTGNGSGSVVITGTDKSFSYDTNDPNTGDGTFGATTSLVRVDTNRTQKYNGKTPHAYGTVTITITPAAGTEVHYSIGIKNPNAKSQSDTTLTKKYKCNVGYIYSVPIVFDPPDNTTSIAGHLKGKKNSGNIVRLRAYKVVNGKVSPNEKSDLLILKFKHHV